jgi:FAD synthase
VRAFRYFCDTRQHGGRPGRVTFAGDLYGRELAVEFVAKLRDEAKFASLELMTEQMHRDAADARRVLEQ